MTFRHIVSGLPSAGNAQNPSIHARAVVRQKLRADPANTVRHPDMRIMQILVGLASSFGKSHCIPTQDKIIELLARFTGRRMCRRTLCRHLNALEEGGYVRRIRRHVADPKHVRGWLMRSTCYVPMWRYCMRLRDDAKRMARILKIQMANPSVASIRVTRTAQYLEGLFKALIPRPGKSPGLG